MQHDSFDIITDFKSSSQVHSHSDTNLWPTLHLLRLAAVCQLDKLARGRMLWNSQHIHRDVLQRLSSKQSDLRACVCVLDKWVSKLILELNLFWKRAWWSLSRVVSFIAKCASRWSCSAASCSRRSSACRVWDAWVVSIRTTYVNCATRQATIAVAVARPYSKSATRLSIRRSSHTTCRHRAATRYASTCTRRLLMAQQQLQLLVVLKAQQSEQSPLRPARRVSAKRPQCITRPRRSESSCPLSRRKCRLFRSPHTPATFTVIKRHSRETVADAYSARTKTTSSTTPMWENNASWSRRSRKMRNAIALSTTLLSSSCFRTTTGRWHRCLLSRQQRVHAQPTATAATMSPLCPVPVATQLLPRRLPTTIWCYSRTIWPR